jgi:uncharacterized membrane protein YgdD (TMEM256/DUF423 family)
MFDVQFMNRFLLMFASIAGLLAVIAGALMSHQLKQHMPSLAQEVYETAVRYQFYHVFALLATGILSEKFSGSRINLAGFFFITGIILFSGSLYIISALLTNSLSVPVLVGICTPLGGLSFILGWIFLASAIWKSNRS